MKKYTNDYEIVNEIDEKGREKRVTVYRGDYFEIAEDEEGLKRFKILSILLLAFILLVHITSGFINNKGMNQVFVAFPFVFSFFPLLYMTSGILSLPKEKRKLKRDEVGLSFERMKSSSFILMFLLGSGILGEIIYLFLNSNVDQIWLEYIFLSLEVLGGLSVYFLINLQKKFEIIKIPKQEKTNKKF